MHILGHHYNIHLFLQIHKSSVYHQDMHFY